LMNEYGLGDYMISDYDPRSIRNMMTDLFDTIKSDTLTKRISLENERREKRLNEMWKQITTVMQT